MRGLTVGQVARRMGMRPSAIRFYEAAGVLPKAERVSGWRRYDASVFEHLAVIELAQEAGFSLDEIRTLLRGFADDTPPPARWAALARKKLPEVEELIARARAMKRLLERGMDCGCRALEECALVAERVQSVTGAVRRESRPASAVRRRAAATTRAGGSRRRSQGR